MSDKTLSLSGLSGRYANALFDLATHTATLDRVESDLLTLQQMIDGSQDLWSVMQSPRLGRDVQTRAVCAVAEKAGLSALVIAFLNILGRNRRFDCTKAIIRDFGILVSDHRHEVFATVTSAVPIAPEQVNALAVELKGKLGRIVRIKTHIEASLIGGVVVRVGSVMYDGSLKTKLNTLKLAMKGVG